MTCSIPFVALDSAFLYGRCTSKHVGPVKRNTTICLVRMYIKFTLRFEKFLKYMYHNRHCSNRYFIIKIIYRICLQKHTLECFVIYRSLLWFAPTSRWVWLYYDILRDDALPFSQIKSLQTKVTEGHSYPFQSTFQLNIIWLNGTASSCVCYKQRKYDFKKMFRHFIYKTCVQCFKNLSEVCLKQLINT